MMLGTIATTNSIKKALKFAFSGFSLVFIAMLFFVLVHDMLTGESSQHQNIVPSTGFSPHLNVGKN
jgi:hypothetical protein